MSVNSIRKAVDSALKSGTPGNFITTSEAKAITAEASKGGVSKSERKELEGLMMNWTYYNDDAFGSKKPFEKPTLSVTAGGEIQRLLANTDTQELDRATAKALKSGGPKNFITGAEAKKLVAAAKADGVINDAEKAKLQSLTMGWTYYDDKAFGRTEAFEKPTLSMNAGIAVQDELNAMDRE